MERKSSLTVQLQRNEKLIKLLIVGVLGAVILCYSLQIIMFLIPIIYPGYNTIKILQLQHHKRIKDSKLSDNLNIILKLFRNISESSPILFW